MTEISPCVSCDNYHYHGCTARMDKCEKYQQWLKQHRRQLVEVTATGETSDRV